MASVATWTSWATGGCISSELLGYFLHRLMHSGVIGFLSRNHMRHHLVLYGPLQKQRSQEYHDATADGIGLGNIGTEWLISAAILIAALGVVLRICRVHLGSALAYLGAMLGWSFLMFSYLHDEMHVERAWLQKTRWLRRWFVVARRRHDIHHCSINDKGLMNRNFGIGFFAFDRMFGTFADRGSAFNHVGYAAARRRFQSLLE